MHRDPYLSYLNRTTPLAMAQLFDRFYIEMRNTSRSYSEISSMLEQCSTGRDRLAAPLLPINATIGHKTGTGFPTPDGRISAVNDCGYVKLPDGTRYSIAVFVADSSYDMAATSAIIAEISNIVWKSLTEHKKNKNMEQKFCQSCGMPLTDDDKGTNADGSRNDDYCNYCYVDGRFRQDLTMEQMVEHCARFTDDINKWSGENMTVEEAKEMMRQFYPTLKRWKNSL